MLEFRDESEAAIWQKTVRGILRHRTVTVKKAAQFADEGIEELRKRTGQVERQNREFRAKHGLE